MIQQTEAFVSIDVNSGKFTGKKKAEETYRKINLEAAKEISRQLRLRNLSGIILIDFINMTNPDHNNELFHVLQKYLRKDPVKCKAIDITPLHILEMTRKKVRKPVIEEIRQIKVRRFFEHALNKTIRNSFFVFSKLLQAANQKHGFFVFIFFTIFFTKPLDETKSPCYYNRVCRTKRFKSRETTIFGE